MEYKHTQKGYMLGGSLIGMAAILAGISAHIGWKPASIVVEIVLLGTAVLFYSLTVSVTGGELVIRFGPGLIRKRIPLSRIRDARIVRNPWYYGWGIHLTPHGWLYNVSGLAAVEVDYISGGRFRIGTDDPKGLLQAIKERSTA
ncbi:MAG TPA: hypothetical protein PLA83_03370 [Deltaproteobacteria bacterium]|nr:hypothetical protein [Deltaproteobacteria bacterium]HQI00220.1 hypothetical protein [Deltaproteobacteria bacterium]HQJ09784.1 hypothetical protein [Deltaproteobacteria bacterium]